jgi:hypothetical protein
MSKRIVDGEALWQSTKLQQVPERWRGEYANLLPLAYVNGTFEADPRKVWGQVYATNRPNIKPKHIETILDCFEEAKMIFRFTSPDGKKWGYFVGVDKPGRLPKASERFKYAKGEDVPPNELADFLGLPRPNSAAVVAAVVAPDSAPGIGTCSGNGTGIGSGNGSGTGTGDGSTGTAGGISTQSIDEVDTGTVQQQSQLRPVEGNTEVERLLSLYNSLSGNPGELQDFTKLTRDFKPDGIANVLFWAYKVSDHWGKKLGPTSGDFKRAFPAIVKQYLNYAKDREAKQRITSAREAWVNKQAGEPEER